ncbi:MAG: ROK family protein [Treponema sp.]|nr:ROK family protein [Treponema sp.]
MKNILAEPVNTSGQTKALLGGEPVIAVDIGGSKFITGLVSPGGKIICEQKYNWTELNSNGVIKDIKTAIQAMLKANPQYRPAAMGATIPGLADPKKGLWVEASFSGIRDLPFASIMQAEFGLPVTIDNDVNACAAAEKLFGCCRGIDHFIWVTVSNGIGGAIFTNSGLYAGSLGNAGEIGHVVVEEGPDARPCKCGHSGCAEMHASGPALALNYIAIGGRQEIDGQPVSAKTIAGLAQAGDKTAMAAFETEGLYLGRAIGAAVNLLNPQKIVIGGGVSLAFDLFWPSLKITLDTHVYRNANPGYTVEPTALGYNAGLLGAAALCFGG